MRYWTQFCFSKDYKKIDDLRYFKIFCQSRGHSWILPESIYDIYFRLGKLLGWLYTKNFFNDPVELYFIDDLKISHFNIKLFNCQGPTNILSFPAAEGLSAVLLLSLNTFKREYRLYDQAPVFYLYFLLTHGISHLSGLEHGDAFSHFQNQCLKYLDL